jgi:hypothetical protein
MSLCQNERVPRWRDKLDSKHRRFGTGENWTASQGPAHQRGETIRHHTTALSRLATIQGARQLGFTLNEIRHLFFGLRDITRASKRWRTLSQRKVADLDDLMDGIKALRGVLTRLMTKCRCDTLDQCGKGIFQSINRGVVVRPPCKSSISRKRFDEFANLMQLGGYAGPSDEQIY